MLLSVIDLASTEASISGEYKCKNDNGALLLLREDAEIREITDKHDAYLREYMEKHYDSWRNWAKKLPLDVNTFFFVRGTIKASDWGAATIRDTSSDRKFTAKGTFSHSVSLRFEISETISSRGSVQSRSGKQKSSSICVLFLHCSVSI